MPANLSLKVATITDWEPLLWNPTYSEGGASFLNDVPAHM
jgi:hypothetical protein